MIKPPSGYGTYLKELVAYEYKKRYGEQIQGVDDLPDPRDYRVAAITDYRLELPDEWNVLEYAERLGYVLPSQSVNSCTAYARIMHADMVNTIWNQRLVSLDAEVQWSHQEATGGTREKGDYIQNAYKQFHLHPQEYPDLEYGRMRFTGAEMERQIKLQLMKFNLVGTGVYWKSDKKTGVSNYTLMRETGWFEPLSGLPFGGHAVVIMGWNKDGWILAEPSRGKWGDNPPGVFRCKYEYTDALFSKYVSKDARDD